MVKKLLGTREQKENKAGNTRTKAVLLIFKGTGSHWGARTRLSTSTAFRNQCLSSPM